MPLVKSPSKKAFSKNVEIEMKAGKPQKQSLAIAYSTMRHAKGRKKMARGGEISAVSERGPSADERDEREMAMDPHQEMHGQDLDARDEHMVSEDERDPREMDMMERKKYAKGGPVDARKEHMNGMVHDGGVSAFDMLSGKSHMHKPELDAKDEHRVSEDSMDDRELDMIRKKYARGGEVDLRNERMTDIDDASSERDMHMLEGKYSAHSSDLNAKGEHHVGEDDEDEREMGMLHAKAQPDSYSKDGIIRYAEGGSVVDSIMRKRKMMADGGEVDLQDSNGDEHLNLEDQLSYQAARKKTYYDNSQISKQPEDSNEHGDDIDSDEHDMISSIRRKMRK